MIMQQRARKNTAPKAIKKFWVYDIIQAPVMTEKSYNASSQANKYSFKVHPDANKIDVKLAIQEIYKVDPEAINVVNAKEKGRANRKLVKKSYKKAIITLKKWDKIDFIA